MRVRIVKIPDDREVWFKDFVNAEFDIDENFSDYYYQINNSNRILPKDCCMMINNINKRGVIIDIDKTTSRSFPFVLGDIVEIIGDFDCQYLVKSRIYQTNSTNIMTLETLVPKRCVRIYNNC